MATDLEDGAGIEAATTLGIDRTEVGRPGHFGPDVIRAMEQVIVGQRYMLERLLVGLLANGHVLIEGVPGLAKTLAVTSLAQALDAGHQSIQFTPDLLPADLIGTLIYQPQSGEFRVRKGPVFTNLLLADEINRAPAKVQSALLEAMQENQVTIGDETHRLPQPFLVLATQNPLEHEGTYPLPEAQVDRFMLKLKITYPDRGEELEILERMARTTPPRADPCRSPIPSMCCRRAGRSTRSISTTRSSTTSSIWCSPPASPIGTGWTSAATSISAPRRAPRSISRSRPRPTRSCKGATTSRRTT